MLERCTCDLHCQGGQHHGLRAYSLPTVARPPSSLSSYVSLASFLSNLPSCLPSSFPSYVSLASFLRNLPSCLPSSFPSYVSLAGFGNRTGASAHVLKQLASATPHPQTAATRPQTACERNASPSNSFRAQRFALKQLASATPRPQTASEPLASSPNGFEQTASEPLASLPKRLPSPSPHPQTASEPLDSPSNRSEAPRALFARTL